MSMWDVIAKLPQEDFEIPARTVESWIKGREVEEP
jgi:hypothetical protein